MLHMRLKSSRFSKGDEHMQPSKEGGGVWILEYGLVSRLVRRLSLCFCRFISGGLFLSNFLQDFFFSKAKPNRENQLTELVTDCVFPNCSQSFKFVPSFFI